MTERHLYDLRKFDARAIRDFLAAEYVHAFRLAVTLAGDVDTGKQIVRLVADHLRNAIPNFGTTGAPGRWLIRHTILTSRRVKRRGERDPLIFEDAPAVYLAAVKALRNLPKQPREAWLLRTAEDLSSRKTGVAMDCSTQAAEVHFATAVATLKPLVGEHYDAVVAAVVDRYGRLVPTDRLRATDIDRAVRRIIWPRAIRRAMRVIIVVAVVVGGVLSYRYLWPLVQQRWPTIFPAAPASQPLPA